MRLRSPEGAIPGRRTERADIVSCEGQPRAGASLSARVTGMRDRRLLFEPLREFERLEVIKGELEDRYVAASYDTGDVAMAQLATAIASRLFSGSRVLG